MRRVTILEKCYGTNASQGLKKLTHILEHAYRGIDIELRSVDLSGRGWVEISFSGRDEVVCLSYLEKTFGVAVDSIDNLNVGDHLRGKIIDSGSVGYGIYVDIGIDQPERIDALVPLHALRTQLVNRRKVPLREIIHAFCFFDNIPLQIVIAEIDRERSIIGARLSDVQIAKIRDWQSLALERLMVVGATSSQVMNSLARSGHRRDVLKVEELGLLENSVICKLGTHAKGLIPELGVFLHGVSMHIFNP